MIGQQKWVATLVVLYVGALAVLADIPNYSIVELEMLPQSSDPGNPAAYDINDEGQVVGECTTVFPRIVVWSDAAAHDRGPGRGFRINATGTILVHWNDLYGFDGELLLDPAGGQTLIEYPDPAVTTQTVDLNDRNQVACTLWDATNPYSIHLYAALWDGGSFILVGPVAADSEGAAVNAQGHMAGRWDGVEGNGVFLYRDGETLVVDSPPFGANVYAMNDCDVIAGTKWYGGEDQRGFKYDFRNDRWTELPSPNRWFVRVNGINNSGQIVGLVAPPNELGQAALWSADGELHLLNDFLSPDSGWQLHEAYAINNAGSICGTGHLNGTLRAFVLIPFRCPGDIVGGNQIDLLDLAMFLSAFSSCTGDANFEPAADLNSDGCIGLDDLGAMLAKFGTSCP